MYKLLSFLCPLFFDGHLDRFCILTIMNRYFSKESIQMSNRNCSSLFSIRTMKIKTTISYHFTPVRLAISKKNQKIGEDVEGVEQEQCLQTAGGNVN